MYPPHLVTMENKNACVAQRMWTVGRVRGALTLDLELQLSLLQLLLTGSCTRVDSRIVGLQRADHQGAV